MFLLIEPYANGIRGTTDGVEIAPTWKPTDWWQIKGSYSYSEHEALERAQQHRYHNNRDELMRVRARIIEVVIQSLLNLRQNDLSSI